MNAFDRLAAAYPWDVSVSDELRRAVAFLGWTVDPADVVRAGYGVGMIGGLLGVALVAVAPARWRLAVGLAALALVLAAVHVVHAGPRLLATARRTNATGAAPELLVLAVLRMRLSPSPERAASFAAETATGRLADGLAGHVHRARGTGRTGLDRFADEWSPWFPALGRAVGLVTAAGRVPAHDRARTLDRAVDVVLDETRRSMQDFAAGIRGPVTALYAFGVLLPTALVALLPAARAAGLAIAPPVVAAVYDVGLPIVLVAAGAWLLARRPVAFPPPDLGPDHPDVADRRTHAGLAGTLAAACGLAIGGFLPGWSTPVAAVGLGIGSALVVYYRPYVAVYRDIRATERGLTDALSVIGRRVAAGQAVERAIEAAAPAVDDEMGEVLADGARRQRQLDVGVETAFLGTRGVLRDVPSPRVRGGVALLAIAGREGQPAGRAILSMASHLDDLREVERSAREDVRTVAETLRSTGALFGPLVGGATVALAGHMSAGGPAMPGATDSLSWLGLAVGWYVLALAAILTVLATGLERGLDRRLVGYRVGTALLLATGTYLGGYVAATAVA